MKVVITYCNSWSYRPQALRVRDEITGVYKDAVVELVPGDSGDFLVEVDGRKLFFNKDFAKPRFPSEGEILNLIKVAA